MSAVQELITEKYKMPKPRKVDSFDSLGVNDFLFGLQVPSEATIGASSSEEIKSSEHKSICRKVGFACKIIFN